MSYLYVPDDDSEHGPIWEVSEAREQFSADELMTAYRLALMADCGQPDSLDSPGARWLTQVADVAAEIVDDNSEPLSLDDVIVERADELVPVYTHERWLVFVDLAAYEEDVTDILGQGVGDDLTATAGVALYLIAQRLLHGLVSDEA